MKTQKAIHDQKLSIKQALIQDYLLLKPRRAVERLLQQNDLNQSFQLYNLLQQNIKTNTNKLRSMLYKKHQNLHQCSQMLNKIQQFAEKIKNIQQQIDLCVQTAVIETDWNFDNDYYSNPILIVEELINQKKFTAAFRKCRNILQDNSLSMQQFTDQDLHQTDPELHYIYFLKVEIINKLQKYLEQTALDSSVISESIEAIEQFLLLTTSDQLQEYIQKEANLETRPDNQDFEEQKTGILELIYEKYTNGQQLKQNILSQEQIIQVIFKFKLLTLRKSTDRCYETKQQKQQNLYNKIFNYFSDLVTILNQTDKNSVNSLGIYTQQETKPLNSKNKLYQIFNLNIQKAVGHISELLITNTPQLINTSNSDQAQAKIKPSTTLSFENQLYQRLLNSQEFVAILGDLQAHFKQIKTQNSQSHHQSINLVSAIKNLWKDFYNQMLEIITKKIDPSIIFHISLPPQVSAELLRFSVIEYSKIVSDKITQYNNELQEFFSNFSELLLKSTTREEKKQIITKFVSLKTQIQLSCSQIIDKKKESIRSLSNNKKIYLIKSKAQKQINEVILIFFLVSSYNLAWKRLLQNYPRLDDLLKQIGIITTSNKLFEISLFEEQNKKIGQVNEPILYQIANSYFNMNINTRLSLSEYIDRWQEQLDQTFASYLSFVKTNFPLRQQLKKLVLMIIKTKLSSLQFN